MPVIGLQLYTLMDVLSDRPATLARIADLGVTAVEPFRLGRTDLTRAARLAEARSLKADIDAAGLTVSSTHARLPDAEDPGWFFEEMAEAARPSPSPPPPRRSPDSPATPWSRPTGCAGTPTGSTPWPRRRPPTACGSATTTTTGSGPRSTTAATATTCCGTPSTRRSSPRSTSTGHRPRARCPPKSSARLGERVELVHVKDGPAVRGEPQVAAGQGSVALADALDAGRDSIRVHIIEADGIAEGADIFDLVAESVAWLKERRGGRA
jgi:hypothetical protein